MIDFLYRHFYEYGTLLRWVVFVLLCGVIVYALMRVANGSAREGFSILITAFGLMYAVAPTRYPFYVSLGSILVLGGLVFVLAISAFSRIGR